MLTMKSPFRESVNEAGVTPVKPFDSRTDAPLGSDWTRIVSVVPRVTVAQPLSRLVETTTKHKNNE